jgi:hypothetical protein
MATITNTEKELQLTLTRRERIAALHGDIRVPLSAVRDVRVTEDAVGAARGLRAPGLNLPHRIKIGTWRGRGRRQFLVARRDIPAVHIFLTGTGFDELVVSLPDAHRVADELRARLAPQPERERAHAQLR